MFHPLAAQSVNPHIQQSAIVSLKTIRHPSLILKFFQIVHQL